MTVVEKANRRNFYDDIAGRSSGSDVDRKAWATGCCNIDASKRLGEFSSLGGTMRRSARYRSVGGCLACYQCLYSIVFLRKLADGFRPLPTAEHGRNVRKLLGDPPEWITPGMYDNDPIVQAAIRFRDAQLGREIERDTRLLDVGVSASLLGMVGGFAAFAGGAMTDSAQLLFGGGGVIFAALGYMVYMTFVARVQEVDNRRLWSDLHGADFPHSRRIPGVALT